MFTEPLFFIFLLVAIVPAAFYVLNREQRKELTRFEESLREATRALLHKMELSVGSQNQKLADHAEFKLDATADQLNQSLEVLRAAIEHQSRQQEKVAERLERLESAVRPDDDPAPKTLGVST